MWKWLCKRIKCSSNCKFNEDIFDNDLLNLSLNQFELKNKDIIEITSILSRRGIKPTFSIDEKFTSV